MMRFILRFLLIFIVIFIIWYLITKFKNPREETINLISGGSGGGKTSSVICRIKRKLFRNYFLWRGRKYKHNHIIYSSFPIYTKKKGKIYNYIKVCGRKFYVYDLELDHLLLKKRFKQDEVIVVNDEFSKVASQFDYNNPNVKYNIDEYASFFRHMYKGLGTCYFMDQCSENIFFQVRRRANYCYNMISTRKLFLLPIMIYEYRKLLLSDEIKNTIEVSDSTDENDIRKFIFFTNPFKNYNSYCYYDRFVNIDRDMQPNARLTTSRCDILKLSSQKPTYYNALANDGISEVQFEAMNEKRR